MSDTFDGPSHGEVAAFLRRHPRFLAEHPELAQNLELPRHDGQATSLASYQLDVLRDKNRELNRRLHELYANAETNERLTVRTHQLTLALMRANNAAETLKTMIACLIEDFGSQLVRVLLHRPLPGLPDADWLQIVPANDASLEPFSAFRESGEPLCGRLRQDKIDRLFGQRADEVQSVALLHLGDLGMLAIGSDDANRFFPGMGTLFLRLMSESLVVALKRYAGNS